MDIGNIEYKGSFQGVNIERYYVANGKRQKENEPALYKNICRFVCRNGMCFGKHSRPCIKEGWREPLFSCIYSETSAKLKILETHENLQHLLSTSCVFVILVTGIVLQRSHSSELLPRPLAQVGVADPCRGVGRRAAAEGRHSFLYTRSSFVYLRSCGLFQCSMRPSGPLRGCPSCSGS